MAIEDLIAEFWSNLIIAGINKEESALKAYDYALSWVIGISHNKKDNFVSSQDMAKAASLLLKAKPIAERIYFDHYNLL